MKIIEVCEGYSSRNVIKKYLDEARKNNIIISFSLFLSIGDIKGNREHFLKNLCLEKQFCNTNEQNALLDTIDKDTVIRIWSSKTNADDYLLLLYLCNLLKDKCDNISVIYTSDNRKGAFDIGALDYKEIPNVLSLEHKLTKREINILSNKWLELVDVNSDLRIIDNGEIINKKYSDYDVIILTTLKELGECKFANLIAKLMFKSVINNANDLIYMYLIDRLIMNNKIKVIEKSDNHFKDIIKIL